MSSVFLRIEKINDTACTQRKFEMSSSAIALVIDRYCFSHRLITRFLENLTDEQLQWQLNPATHSIAFHAWHLARWADHLQAAFPGMTPELGRLLGPGKQHWYRDSIAAQWGFDDTQLGFDSTGMHMEDAAATSLIFPAKDELLRYVIHAFELVDNVVRQIDEIQFEAAEQPQPLTEGIWEQGSVGRVIIAYHVHDNRHLGMMECLLGLQSGRGTATQ
jgi:hypothetical protein